MRKKSKKEGHHEIALKQNGKENKLDKVGSYIQSFDRSNWTESLQSLNSSVLEEEFLPHVVQQKKEQRKLHQLASTSSLPTENSPVPQESCVAGSKRRRSGSLPTPTDFSMKPPIPRKKPKTPTSQIATTPEEKSSSKRSKKQHNVEEQYKDNAVEEQKGIASAEKLFAWLIGPVKSDQFFRCVRKNISIDKIQMDSTDYFCKQLATKRNQTSKQDC